MDRWQQKFHVHDMYLYLYTNIQLTSFLSKCKNFNEVLEFFLSLFWTPSLHGGWSPHSGLLVKSMRGFIKSVSHSVSQYHIFTLKVNRSVSQPVRWLVVWFCIYIFWSNLICWGLFFPEKSEKTGLLKSFFGNFLVFFESFFSKIWSFFPTTHTGSVVDPLVNFMKTNTMLDT